MTVPEGWRKRVAGFINVQPLAYSFRRALRDAIELLPGSGGSRPDYRPSPPARLPRSLREQISMRGESQHRAVIFHLRVC
jgi:hypothetical protein